MKDDKQIEMFISPLINDEREIERGKIPNKWKREGRKRLQKSVSEELFLRKKQVVT